MSAPGDLAIPTSPVSIPRTPGSWRQTTAFQGQSRRPWAPIKEGTRDDLCHAEAVPSSLGGLLAPRARAPNHNTAGAVCRPRTRAVHRNRKRDHLRHGARRHARATDVAHDEFCESMTGPCVCRRMLALFLHDGTGQSRERAVAHRLAARSAKPAGKSTMDAGSGTGVLFCGGAV
jgi:hypothetical protein